MKALNTNQAKQDKIKNIIDMAFGFSAMTRVFEKHSDRKIIDALNCCLPKIASSKSQQDFQKQHDCFCHWFKDEIKTAERKSKKDERIIKPSGQASYGQGAKVLDVALKVFVYYCHLPDPETADRTMKWLYAAIDTKMMKHLKKMKDPEASIITANSIEGVANEDVYTALQSLVRKDIKNRDKSPNKIYPVQWDDIMWRELNNKDKTKGDTKTLDINSGPNQRDLASSNICRVPASITGQTNTYKTGIEKGQEILEINLSKPGYYQHNIPWHGNVGIKLVIGHRTYDGMLNLKRKDKVPWISSVIHDMHGKKMQLRTPLIASGYNKGQRVSLQIDALKKEVKI